MTQLAPRPTRTTPVIARRRDHEGGSERAARAARGVAIAYLEIRSGRRPATCLDRHATPWVADQLHRVARVDDRMNAAAAEILRTRVSPSRRGIDATVIYRADGRTRVVAMRLEIRDHHWIITRLGTPEDHMRRMHTAVPVDPAFRRSGRDGATGRGTS